MERIPGTEPGKAFPGQPAVMSLSLSLSLSLVLSLSLSLPLSASFPACLYYKREKTGGRQSENPLKGAIIIDSRVEWRAARGSSSRQAATAASPAAPTRAWFSSFWIALKIYVCKELIGADFLVCQSLILADLLCCPFFSIIFFSLDWYCMKDRWRSR